MHVIYNIVLNLEQIEPLDTIMATITITGDRRNNNI